nr:acyltransferase [Brevibacterium renqingii]
MHARTCPESTAVNLRIQESADVDASALIGEGSSIWHLAQVRDGARLGKNVVVGRGAYIGSDVHVGDNSKIQNYALVYEPADLANGVFIGPAAVLTNDTFPRAINPDGGQKDASDWDAVGVRIEQGAAIGARAVCVAPVRIGAWATVAAGAVVTSDVPPHALVAGVPARRIKWVGKSGTPLEMNESGLWKDNSTGDVYREKEDSDELEEVSE